MFFGTQIHLNDTITVYLLFFILNPQQSVKTKEEGDNMYRMSVFTVFLTVLTMFSGCTMLIRDPEKAYNKGIELIKEKKIEKAYKYFLSATKKQPDNPKYHWAAAQVTRNQNAAFIHTEMAWKNGMKTVPVMAAIIRMSLFANKDQRTSKMVSLFNELPDSIKTPLLKADLFSEMGESDSALNIWKGKYASKPSPFLAFKIGRELNVKKDPKTALEFLETARKSKMLDGAGYVLLASMRAYEYDYEGIDEIFKETKKLGLYSNEVALEEASFLFISGKFDAAAAILSGYRQANPDQKDQLVNHRARINLAFMYAMRKENDSINKLISEIPDSSPVKTIEQRFYKLLQEGEKMGPSVVLKELDEIRKAIPENPFVNLFTARALLKNKQAEKSVEIYQRLPGIYLRSPGILTEYAMALASIGKENEALVALSIMHKRKSFTRTSLELFRDLTFKKNLLEKSEFTQHLLEKLYGNDARIRWNGAILALRTGKVDSALTLLTDLEKQFPDEPRFRTTRISAMIIKGDYDNALALCHSVKAPRELIIPLETQILKKQGKEAEALQIIESARKEKDNPQLSIIHAEMLMGMDKNQDAAKIYEDLLASRKSDKEASAQTGALYNNMAWALLHAEKPDKKSIMNAVGRAYQLLPGSPNVLDTYAEALLRFGDYAECIKILEDSKLTTKEPKLLFQLAMAYEKKNDLNKAVRNFKTVTAMMDSSKGSIEMDINKAAVERHIEKIMNKE